MNISNLSSADLIGFAVSFILTLLVFSYLIGDNPLFRLAISLFVGVATGYAAVVAFYSVILPRLLLPVLGAERGEQILSLVPLALGALMLLKLSPSLAKWGNFAMAFLVGVGAASAVGGAINGTLFPQVGASINLFDRQATAVTAGANFWIQFVNSSLVLVGTIATLAYFHFSTRARADQPAQRPAWMEEVGRLGQIFIAITFGTLFAGVYAAAMAALVERFRFVVDFVKALIASILQ